MERRGKMRDAAFVEFATQAEAARHCRNYTNLSSWVSRLTVEYAKPYHERLAAQQCNRVSSKSVLDENIKNEKDTRKQDQTEKGSKKKIKYNSSPGLHYVYPPVNVAILTNIAHTLVCVPRFYVQVLHLMNKMNLPAPFGHVTPTPPLVRFAMFLLGWGGGFLGVGFREDWL
ncbi:RNA-binding region-containing protein 3 [Desmophyllum pertusum]|uniref:RNA-binding region-containing protein 3 n=1 Tax=Desmophyllum pertusum TaxID=174260 RepID=A0A9X0CQD7_9CNID|nr:RNA-binding region-containing protein 3 [Desmophyllum pertusum]